MDEARPGVTGQATQDPLHVVGIGASTGGLEALRALFARLPADVGAAWVVVVHLSPEHESHLAELLQPHTRMAVKTVVETSRLEPDVVYVIPPSANLEAINSHLRLSPLEEHRRDRAPVNYFLRTLAAAHAGHAIGIVLTGQGSDGALGLRQVRRQGGLTIVQDPTEAEAPSMPRSAVDMDAADLVLPLAWIGEAVRRFVSTRPALRRPESGGASAAAAPALRAIVAEVEGRMGDALAAHRPVVAARRVERRMRLHGLEAPGAYLGLLRERPDEARALFGDLLRAVTEFFSPAPLFEALVRTAVPRAFEDKAGDGRVRAWAIGCATGETAYSTAILLLEEAPRRGATAPPQVFASDLSPQALERARAGVYPPEIAAQVSPERLERYFERRADGHYRVRAVVRDLVVFAHHNAATDPPFPHIDLAVCCDLLHELEPSIRRRVLDGLVFALEPRGLLALEPNGPLDEDAPFESLTPHGNLYVPREAARRAPRRQPEGAPAAGQDRREMESPTSLHGYLRGRFAPPSVLIDAGHRIIHYSRDAGRYIEPPGGEPTRAIDQLVRAPLRAAVREGLAQTAHGEYPWRSIAVDLEIDGTRLPVAVCMTPMVARDGRRVRLVAFEPQGTVLRGDEAGDEAPFDAEAWMRAVTSEYADDRERSATAQEELMSANEELQSVLQDLRASKQALQTSYEEMTVLGAEHIRKITQLGELSTDLRSLIESTGVAALVLDRELRIVRFTDRVPDLFPLRPSDVGRPLSDLTHRLRYAELEADARRVLRDQVALSLELEADPGHWFLTRLLPYRDPSGAVGGVTLTFMDITERHAMEEALRDADRRKDDFLATLAHELRNPLAPIMSGIDVLRAAGHESDVTAHVTATIERQAHLLARLVDDLLDISRLREGRLRLRTSPTALADIVWDAVALVQSRMDDRGHQLEVAVPDEPLVVEADAERLTQVLGNLLINAIEYTPDGGHVTVRVERRDGTVAVAVEDTGIGLSEASRERIFDLFVRGTSVPTRSAAGLGIGLTLARSLTRMHGGTLTADSPGPGEGSTFTVTLPLAAVAAARAAPAQAGPGAAGRRVLIVDDNADAAEMLEMLVLTIGADAVHTASSGSEALALAPEFRPDVVLLDLSMPGMDGYEVARRMRREPWGRSLQLVALTGWGQDEHRRRTRDAGFDLHLTKPADRATLESVLTGSRPDAEPR